MQTLNPTHLQPKAASSIYFNWEAPVCRWFYNEATILESTAGSFFAICGWNTGYFGIQQLGDGNKIAIFSVWDQTKGDDPNAVPLDQRVEVLHAADDVIIRRFGNEGTGRQCKAPFNWNLSEPVRCIVQANEVGEKTSYAGWLYYPAERCWKHIVTFRVKTGGKLLSGLYSFIEDFRRDTKSAGEKRRCVFSDGWAKCQSGDYHFIQRGKFSSPQGPDEANDLIDAGSTDLGLYLATGGDTSKSAALLTTFIQPVIPNAPPQDIPSQLILS